MAEEDKEDNLSKQIDEIEVLTSIYGDEWHVEDEATRHYYIDIQGDSESGNLQLRLSVILPVEYPSGAPPQYRVNAPWLRGESRLQLENALQDIYLENLGESILYLWIERTREFLQELTQAGDGAAAATTDTPTVSTDSSDDLISAWTVPSLDDRGDEAGGDVDKESTGGTSLSQFMHKKPAEEALCPVIYHSEFLWDRKSKFQSHLAAVYKKEEIELVRNKLLENRKIAAATHNIVAYRIRVPNSDIMYQSCEDDGEFGAGGRMLHLLNVRETLTDNWFQLYAGCQHSSVKVYQVLC
ncbi:protein IMPACT-like isoform X2 [Haliotis rubra]|uniref:protein IMPACT-like isoform X2 n=1 Tax=Haliotis rubra TaxID=36100 RepID=UPI001EE54049|nr:protein IMPACT-like isoform X2 [Haliotis rubra]